jgi:hypothetical protein
MLESLLAFQVVLRLTASCMSRYNEQNGGDHRIPTINPISSACVKPGAPPSASS